VPDPGRRGGLYLLRYGWRYHTLALRDGAPDGRSPPRRLLGRRRMVRQAVRLRRRRRDRLRLRDRTPALPPLGPPVCHREERWL